MQKFLQNTKLQLSLILALLCIISGVILFELFKKNTSQTSDEGRKSLPVASYSVSTKVLKNSYRIQTYLLPWKEVVLRPLPQTHIRMVHVKVGDLVKAGDVLVSLNSEVQELKRQLDNVEMQMRNIDFSVTQALAQKSFMSKNEYLQKQLEHQAIQIRSKLSKIDNSEMLKAPIDGTVSEISVKDGDYIDQTNTNAFVKIVDDSKLRAEVFLPSDIAEQIDNETSVYLTQTRKTSQGKQIKANIGVLSPVIDLKTGTVFSELHLSQIPLGWKPGIFVEAEYVISENPKAIALPVEAVVYENAKPYVYVIKVEKRNPASENDEEYVKKVPVQLGIRDRSDIEIVSGIEELDQIVVQGQGALSDGAKVEVLQ